MARWIEVLESDGTVHLLDPEQIVSVGLSPNKAQTTTATVMLPGGTIVTHDTESVARLRAVAFEAAGLGEDGLAKPPASAKIKRVTGIPKGGF